MEIHKYIRLFILLAFVVTLANIGAGYYADEQDARGVAIADFMDYYHGIPVAPEDARFFDMSVTTIDVVFSADTMNIDVFEDKYK